MKFPPGLSKAAIIGAKRKRILNRHRECLGFWKSEVIPVVEKPSRTKKAVPNYSLKRTAAGQLR
jgi:hypothetical protein